MHWLSQLMRVLGSYQDEVTGFRPFTSYDGGYRAQKFWPFLCLLLVPLVPPRTFVCGPRAGCQLSGSGMMPSFWVGFCFARGVL